LGSLSSTIDFATLISQKAAHPKLCQEIEMAWCGVALRVPRRRKGSITFANGVSKADLLTR
jgi:hypothetical protein